MSEKLIKPKTVSDKILERAQELFGDDADKKDIFLLGAYDYRKYVIEEINLLLPEIKFQK